MSSTERHPWRESRLARTGTLLGHTVVLVVCLGILGGWVVRTVQHISLRIHQPAVPAFGAADVVYFFRPDCPACQMAHPVLVNLQRRYPRYRWAGVDLSYPRGMELAEQYYRSYRVPEGSRWATPVVFAGTRTFTGWHVIREQLPAYLGRVTLTRPRGRQARAPGGPPAGAASIQARFVSFRVAPVLLAGLVDSINPCAIATLIFFLSYLTLGGRRPRDLLVIGGLFTFGVFLTYFLIGLGLLRALHSLQAVPVLARALYPVAGLGTLALAAISFLDYRRARRGETAQIALQLPRGLKLRVHQVIRTQLGLRHLALAAFATAVLVSALEFTCTSQVYLPTLMYMAQTGSQRVRAATLLLLYNLMFVLPLIVIFAAAYFGVSARTLAKVAARHTATAKLAMSLLFVGFTLYLFTIGVRMLVAG